ncbi:BON domain-containing protein [Azospirillum sp. Marseille-Q6669]
MSDYESRWRNDPGTRRDDDRWERDRQRGESREWSAGSYQNRGRDEFGQSNWGQSGSGQSGRSGMMGGGGRQPGYGYEGQGREGFDYGRDYWRQQEGRGDYGQGSYGQSYGQGTYGQGSGNRDYGRDYGSRGSFGQGQRDWRSREDRQSYEDRGDYGQDFGYRGGFGRSDYGSGAYGGRDYGSRDYGGMDYGSRGTGNRDYSSRDYGNRDYGRMGYSGGSGYGRNEERGFFERAGDEMASWFGDEDAERRRRMDARNDDPGAQHHRGRGPRGYTRSDDRIREDVNDRLTDDPYIDASEIDVTVSNCEVTLSGTVGDRRTKRRAEDMAETISGVRHVQNNLRVRERTFGGTGTTAGASAMAGLGGTGSSGTGMSGSGMGSTGMSGSTTGTSGTSSTSGTGMSGTGMSGTSGTTDSTSRSSTSGSTNR